MQSKTIQQAVQSFTHRQYVDNGKKITKEVLLV